MSVFEIVEEINRRILERRAAKQAARLAAAALPEPAMESEPVKEDAPVITTTPPVVPAIAVKSKPKGKKK